MLGRLLDFLNVPLLKIVLGAIAVIALVAMISAGARDAIQPRPTPPASTFEQQFGRPDPGFHPDSASDYVDKLARDSGGDWNKLSAEDQRYVNGLTAGHGAIYLRDRAKWLKKNPGATPPSPTKTH
jgi:hypothetical protein